MLVMNGKRRLWDVKRSIPEKVHPVFQHLLSTRFHNSPTLTAHTDGSKCEDTVVAAFYKNGLSETFILPKECSVFSAEAYAIKKTVSIPNIRIEFIILTGSASCLQALEMGTLKKFVDPLG